MKSFSQAARAKFITQSAMSHLIKGLEDEMGVKLFTRYPKTVEPTPAGRLFYFHARAILEQYRQMEEEVLSLSNRVKGPLLLAASPTVAAHLLPQVLYDFSRRYPEVHINLSVGNTEEIIAKVRSGEEDMGIVEGKIKEESGVWAEKIAEDEIVVIASDANPLAKKRAVTALDLLSQPFIMPEPGSGLRELIVDYLRLLAIQPEDISVAMTIGSSELIIRMAQSNLGIAFASRWSLFKALKESSLKILKVSQKGLERGFYLVSAEKEPSTMTARAFGDFIRGYRFFAPLQKADEH